MGEYHQEKARDDADPILQSDDLNRGAKHVAGGRQRTGHAPVGHPLPHHHRPKKERIQHRLPGRVKIDPLLFSKVEEEMRKIAELFRFRGIDDPGILQINGERACVRTDHRLIADQDRLRERILGKDGGCFQHPLIEGVRKDHSLL